MGNFMRAKPVIAAIKFDTSRIFKWVSMAKISGYQGWVAPLLLVVLCVCPSQAIAQGESPVLVESTEIDFLTGKKLKPAKYRLLLLGLLEKR